MSLNFKIGLDISEFVQGSQALKQEIQKIVDAHADSGTSISQSIAEQKRVLQEMTRELEELEKQLKASGSQGLDVQGLQESRARAEALTTEIERQRQEISLLEQAREAEAQAMQTTRQASDQLGASLSEQTQHLQEAGAQAHSQTEEIRRLSDETERLGKSTPRDLKVGLDISGIIQGTDEYKARLQQIVSEHTQSGHKIADTIRVQKRVIGEMTGELKRMEAELGKTNQFAPGYGEMKRLIAELKREIEGERTELYMLEEAQRAETRAQKASAEAKAQTSKGAGSLRSRLRELAEEMAHLRATTGDQTEEYRKLAAEYGNLKDIQGDIQAQGRILSNDDAGLQATIQGLQGVSGAFSAVAGAMTLVNAEDEKLQRLMAKTMAITSVFNGIMQVSQVLNKDSALVLKAKASYYEFLTLAKHKATVAQRAGAIATAGSTTAQIADTTATNVATASKYRLIGALRALWATLLSNPFTAILALIGAVAGAIYLFTQKTREAEEAQRKFNDEVAKSAGEPIGAMLKLKTEWESLGSSIQAKQAFVRKYREEMKALGIEIYNTADAERFFAQNTEKFIQAQIHKARASKLINNEDFQKDLAESTKANDTRDQIEANKEKIEALKKAPIHKGQVALDGRIAEIQRRETLTKQLEKQLKGQEEAEKRVHDALQKSNEESLKYTDLMGKIKQDAIKKNAGTYQGYLDYIDFKIKEKEEELKGLALNDEEGFKRVNKQLDNLKKLKAEKEGKEEKKPKSDKKEKEHPIKEQIDKARAVYQQLHAIEEGGNKEAIAFAQEFHRRYLDEGQTFLDYLIAQRERIANAPRLDATALMALDEAIAGETTKKQSEIIREEIDEALEGAISSVEKIQSLEEQKKRLLDSDLGVTIKKTLLEYIVDKEKQAVKEAKKEYQEAQRASEEFIQSQLSEVERYQRERRELEAVLQSDTAGEGEKAVAQTRLGALDLKIDTQQKQRLKELEEQYGSHLERLKELERKYNEDIATIRAQASEAEQAELLRRREQDYRKDQSASILKDIKENSPFASLFEDLEAQTKTQVENLLRLFHEQEAELRVRLSPSDFAKLKKEVKGIEERINQTNNPFKAITNGLKELSRATDKEERKKAIVKLAQDASVASRDLTNALGGVSEALGAIGVDVQGLEDLTKTLDGALQGASQAVAGFASGNILQGVQGAMKSISSIASGIFGSRDKKADRRIQEHKREVDRLKESYQDLERAVGKALGTDEYTAMTAQVRNLQQQQARLRAMEREERGKKKSDSDKVAEYQRAQREAQREQEELIDKMREEILGTSAKEAAQQLGEAFVEAFAQGEDALSSFGKKADEIVANITRRLILKDLFEKPLGQVIDRYSKKWVNNDGKLIATVNQIKTDSIQMGKELKETMARMSAVATETLKQLPEDILKGKTEKRTLSGEVKGVTEQTATIIEGTLNAIRINMEQASQQRTQTHLLIGAQVQHLSNIERNTARLENIENLLRAQASKTTPLSEQAQARSLGLSDY